METDSERNLRFARETGATINGAVGIAVGQSLNPGEQREAIEQAMSAALQQAQADGITDPDALRVILRTAADEARRG